ncbi:hypothetical protein BTJ39_19345 [Izhakiella australiensis]|uniref:Uncharacterized protein n=1 Tax=Izhakiella australiensis TaxID=1926881 RepID=A0A1S8YGV9_9GAMM|nr:hypothetical protein BTJ39_19345 [Izhakiella australiensis]
MNFFANDMTIICGQIEILSFYHGILLIYCWPAALIRQFQALLASILKPVCSKIITGSAMKLFSMH